MQSQEIRQKFLDFFKNLPGKEHAVLPSASLVTSDEKGLTNSTLFNTAGMQPLIPYLLGAEHPAGKRLVSVQKCLRTTDIDSIGDNTHATFFEMLGNWSLGDYWKKEAIEWSYEFLTSSEKGLGLDPHRLYVTVFEGDANAPRDDESFEIWKNIFERNGISGERIYFMSAETNWWSAGDNGPCGPDTEMFYDLTGDLTDGMSKEDFIRRTDVEQKVVEIWNDVFMEYEKKDGAVIGKLPQRNVDTGAGLERLTAVLQKTESIFDTDIFEGAIDSTEQTGELSKRIALDHFRTALFLSADGVTPANKDRGYVMRRLIRRGYMYLRNISKATPEIYLAIFDKFVEKYIDVYSELVVVKESGYKTIADEIEKFIKVLSQIDTELEKKTDPFILATTHGLPLEVILEKAKERGIEIDIDDFNKKMSEHQSLSRAGAEQKFKGGLADTSEISVRYHTATHLLHQALHDVLGEHVEQKGSNITPERLRFDFAHGQKMTDEEKKRVEDIVNEKIDAAISVNQTILPKEEALRTGARHLFNEKYGDEISIYYIGDTLDTAYSKEFCGGPHVKNTSEIGKFKIAKEEAVSAGVRRIKATLQ